MAILTMIPAALAVAAAIFVALFHGLNLVMVLLAWREVRKQRIVDASTYARIADEYGDLPGITVVIPAFNEQVAIVRTVRSMLNVHYRDLEIVVVNDGSTDRTMAELRTAFNLVPSTRSARSSLATQRIRAVFECPTEPRLVVIDKRNGGKADALNAGISFSCKELVCAVDADVVVDPDALLHLARPFFEDQRTVATSGLIRLTNGCTLSDDLEHVTPGMPRRLVEAVQVLEFIRSFSLGRMFFNQVNAHLIISGAFGLFRRSLLLELEGYQTHSIGEDMELVVRAHSLLRSRSRDYRIVFVADALLFTEGPLTLRDLGKQRTRWHQGLLSTLQLHRHMLFRRRYGAVGMLAFPYFLFLELLSPFVELFGWFVLPIMWALGWITPLQLAPFFAAAYALAVLVSLQAILLDQAELGFFHRLRDLLMLVACAFVEPVGYHQAMLFFRLRAFPRYYGKIHLRGGWVSPRRAPGEEAGSGGSAPGV